MDILFLILVGGALLIGFLSLIKPLLFPQALGAAIMALAVWDFIEKYHGSSGAVLGTH